MFVPSLSWQILACFVYEMTENVRQTRSETQKSTISCGVNRTGHELL